MMPRNLIFILFITCLPIAVFAQPSEIFTVQIGTYQQYEDNARKSAGKFGEVHVFTFQNLSRVTVGEFTSREEATKLLQKLKQSGFEDAFVRQIGYADLSQVQSDIEKFNVLIAESDAQAFYLDGDMYLFQGRGYIKIPR